MLLRLSLLVEDRLLTPGFPSGTLTASSDPTIACVGLLVRTPIPWPLAAPTPLRSRHTGSPMESPGACPGLTTPQQRRGRQSRGKRSLIRSSPEDSGYDSLPPTPDKQHVALDGAAGRHRGFHDGIAYYLTRGSPIRLDRPGSYHTDPYYAPEDAVDWACSAFYAGDAYYLPGCSVDARCPKFLDGNRSSRGAASDSDEIGVGTRATRDDDADKPVTLPRPIPKPRHSLPAAFFTDAVPKSPRRSSDVRPSRATPAALRQPDRFVPHRDHGAGA